jgi:hypothetical protein
MDNQEKIKEKLRGLQLTIDKLDKAYGKGTTVISTMNLSEEEIEKESKRIEILRLKRSWVQFIHFKQSTELWDKVDFEQIIENSEHLLKVSYSLSENGPYYTGETDNEKTIKRNEKIIEKLKEIYEERFKEEQSEDLKIYTNAEKFYLLEQTGFTENKNYKLLSETNKCKLLAKILGCKTETAKKVKNKDYRYTVNEVSKIKIDTFLTSIK